MKIKISFLVLLAISVLAFHWGRKNEEPPTFSETTDHRPTENHYTAPYSAPAPAPVKTLGPLLTSSFDERKREWETEVDRFLAERDPEGAVRMLAGRLEKEPDNLALLQKMGAIHLHEMQQPVKAIPFLEKALGREPQNGEALHNLVGSYLGAEQGERGAEFLSELVQQNPEAYDARLALGDLLASEGKLSESLAVLTTLVADPKAPPDARVLLAHTLLAHNQSQAAEEQLRWLVGHQQSQIAAKAQRGEPTFDDRNELAVRLRELTQSQLSQGKRHEARETAMQLPESPERESLLKKIAATPSE